MLSGGTDMSGVTCQVCHTGVSYRCVICTDVMTCQVCRTGVLYRYVVQVCCRVLQESPVCSQSSLVLCSASVSSTSSALISPDSSKQHSLTAACSHLYYY